MFVAHLVATIMINRKHFDFLFQINRCRDIMWRIHQSLIYGVAFNFDFRT